MGESADRMASERVVTGVRGPRAGAARLAESSMENTSKGKRNRGVGNMAQAQMSADEILKLRGKPSGPSRVEGEDDPIVIWPYPDGDVRFRYRDKAWRVWP